jgi:hypothetical protein
MTEAQRIADDKRIGAQKFFDGLSITYCANATQEAGFWEAADQACREMEDEWNEQADRRMVAAGW